MNELNLFPVSAGEPLACAALDLHNSAHEQFACNVQNTGTVGEWIVTADADTKQHVVQDPEKYTATSAWIAQVADDTTHIVDSAMPCVTKAAGDTKKSIANPATEFRTYDTRDYKSYMYDSATHHHDYDNVAAHATVIARKSTSKIYAIATAAVVGAVVVPLVIGAVAPVVAGALGFSAKGIVAHSVAAGMMSTMGGAVTQAGSLVATMQAIGATGAVAFSPAVSAVAAVVGASVASAAAKGSVLAIDAATAAGRDRVEK
ncbi:hypothetical protein AMAG_18245 [Allomyces macrogynus ATCC 38327]|uniref:Transmembrane protein n=1 Tax=Allomyces macrogynus (strain ATCC 38327) TaxID=578462 RepID=A0A0L0S7T9_ALLM3|nr:hypothetical protein AMAG_18245 [Allomyces macrogynus ATCC 38327]|eukprot:KNE58429.1 hypothetical protein AMAG_18245 [Allomyces macrogynus ATCC 38327]